MQQVENKRKYINYCIMLCNNNAVRQRIQETHESHQLNISCFPNNKRKVVLNNKLTRKTLKPLSNNLPKKVNVICYLL